ncbi:MAG: hypothetical protein LBJ90_08855, partial [Treponema sp.]|nr:hypothetical protein [Treponema sp.]
MKPKKSVRARGSAARKTGMARLWELAFRKKILVAAACVFSVASTALSFSPFIAVYYLIRSLVIHFSGLGGLDRSYMIRLGWLAAGGAAGAIFL